MRKLGRIVLICFVANVALPALANSIVGKYIGKPTIDFSVVQAAGDAHDRERLYARLEAMRDVVFTLTLNKDKTFSSLSEGGPGNQQIRARGTWTTNGHVVSILIFETNGKKRRAPKAVDLIKSKNGETLHMASPYGGKSTLVLRRS